MLTHDEFKANLAAMAANDLILAFETGHLGAMERAIETLTTQLGGDFAAVQRVESPFTIMAYFLALAIRHANTPK